MLSEFVLSPAIFRVASYESNAMADVCLRPLGKALLDDCIIRDLGAGEWHKQLSGQGETLHEKGKELLKKLKSQGRLCRFPLVGTSIPENDREWEIEGLNAHDPPDGFIFSSTSKENRHSGNKLVTSPELLPNAPFWEARTCSKRIPRSLKSYQELLNPLLRYAGSILLIDPHLDPSETRYRGLIGLFTSAAVSNRDIKPRIEVHRGCWLGNSDDKRSKAEEIEKRFRDNWEAELRRYGITVDLFLWDDFHDRFFLTNLLGLSWSNGFDTTTDPSATVTVAKISRDNRYDVQSEFAQNSTSHRLDCKFRIGI